MSFRLQSLPHLAASVVVFTSTLTATLAATPAQAERLVLEPMIVVAARHTQPAAQTAASVTLLDAQDLARHAALPLEEILASQAGVTIARTGGAGQQVSVFMRGSESDSTLVLVDGININGGTLGGAALQNLRGADIERVEIVRGPRSALYGSEAIGGVISITTKRAQKQDSQALFVGGGSDNTTEMRASANRDLGETQLSASIGRLQTDGDAITARTPVTGEHDNTSSTLAVATQLGDTRLSIDTWASQGRTQYANCVYDPVTFACTSIRSLHQEFNNSVISLGSETRVGENNTLRARVGHAGDELDQVESADFAQTRRLSGSLEWQNRMGGNTLVAGIDSERESVEALGSFSAIDSINDNRAVFLRDDLQRGNQQFGLGLRNAVYDSFGEHWTGDASYGLHVGSGTFGWLGYGRGFRAPDTSERFGGGGNPALQPETTDSGEIGLRQQFGAHEVTVTGFIQHIDDLIDYPAPLYSATNIAQARITGSEFGWRWRNDATRLDAFVTLLDAVDDSTGARLPRRPAHQFSASAQHRLGAVTLRASLLAMDERDNSAYDAIVLPRFITADVGVNWAATKTLSIDARIENIGDAEYHLAGDGDLGDYRMPDRGAFIGVEWKPQTRPQTRP